MGNKHPEIKLSWCQPDWTWQLDNGQSQDITFLVETIRIANQHRLNAFLGEIDTVISKA